MLYVKKERQDFYNNSYNTNYKLKFYFNKGKNKTQIYNYQY